MRILHTADWHLGRMFYGMSLLEDQAYVLDQLVAVVRETKPDVLLIAGDIYDRSLPPADAVKLLDEVLTRICIEQKVPVIAIAGNHDSPERIGFGSRLFAPQGLYLNGICVDLQPVILTDRYGPVYFYPIPYTEPALARALTGEKEIQDHDQAMAALMGRVCALQSAGVRTVIVAHAFVAGCTPSESERDLSVGGTGAVSAAHFAPFHYVALGHLHQPQAAGGMQIYYAGSLLKYSFAEAGHRKAVLLVEMDGQGQITQEAIPLTPRHDLRVIEGTLAEILRGPQAGESRDDYLKVILQDEGALYDPIGKLREVYPHVMELERRKFEIADGGLDRQNRDLHRMSERDLFTAFYEYATGRALTPAQEKVMQELLERFLRQEREVQV